MERPGRNLSPWTSDDMSMVNYLVDKYGVQELLALLAPAVAAAPSYHLEPAVASRANTLRPNGGRLDGTVSRASLISNASSGSFFSDVSSVAGSAGHEAIESKPAAFHRRSDGHPRRLTSRATSRPPATRPSPQTGATKETSFECPFCAEAGIPRSIARKSDLKRHFHQFHHTNAQWTCSLPGCGMVFDWKSAYEGHLKEVHRGIHRDETGVETCPQVVFGCGFNTCKQVYEASSDADASSKAADYFVHIANHFNSGESHHDWSYTTRLRNLMRQTHVDDVWKRRTRDRGQNDRLKWHPQTSSTIRKMLETRHFPDIPLLVKWAVVLGSHHHSALQPEGPRLPQELAVPVRQYCFLSALDHAQPQPFEAPVKAEGDSTLHHNTLPPGCGAMFSPPLTPLEASTSMTTQPPGAFDSGTHFGHELSIESAAPTPATTASGPFASNAAMPLASSPMETAADGPMSLLSTSQHPLLCYHGFSLTARADLPSPQAVIADIDRRFHAKSQSPTDMFPGITPVSYPETQGPLVLGDDLDAAFDVEMGDNCLPSEYYQTS